MKIYAKSRRIFLFLVITAISLILNWFVQLVYYLYITSQNPLAFLGQKTLLDYLTGIVGDGLIVPVINVLTLSVFLNLHFKPSKILVLKAFFLALVTDFLTHFLQAKLALVNWSMPKPFAWNFAGYWHMISLPIQTTYLYLFFYTVIKNWSEIKNKAGLKKPVLAVFGLMLLFAVLSLFDNGRI